MLAAEDIFNDGKQPVTRGLRIRISRFVRHVASEQVGNVRHERFQDAGIVVAYLGQQAQPAQDVAPQAVELAAFADGLPTQHERALHHCQRANFVQQAGFADAALAAHQPGSALAVQRLSEHARERGNLGITPDEVGGLQETLADSRRLLGDWLLGSFAQRGDDGSGVVETVCRLLGEQAA